MEHKNPSSKIVSNWRWRSWIRCGDHRNVGSMGFLECGFDSIVTNRNLQRKKKSVKICRLSSYTFPFPTKQTISNRLFLIFFRNFRIEIWTFDFFSFSGPLCIDPSLDGFKLRCKLWNNKIWLEQKNISWLEWLSVHYLYFYMSVPAWVLRKCDMRTVNGGRKNVCTLIQCTHTFITLNT